MEPRTLVLNAWMRPHGIVTWQQAICLIDLLQNGKCIAVGKADTLETYELTVSSPTLTVNIPAVIRLRREVKAHKNGVKFSRANVYTRDGNRCCYCGERFDVEDLNYDHVVPRVKGGKTTWENIVTSCYGCNGRKGQRTVEQAGMKMHFKPYRPTTLPIGMPVIYRLSTVPEEWKPYLPEWKPATAKAG